MQSSNTYTVGPRMGEGDEDYKLRKAVRIVEPQHDANSTSKGCRWS